jgi:hypothetical protein
MGFQGVAIDPTAWRQALPPADSEAGQALLHTYNNISHAIVIGLVLLIVAWLAYDALRHQQPSNQPATQARLGQRWIQAITNHPIAAALFVAYTIAMVQGASWYYPELIGWYRDIFSDNLLNNFSLRDGLISETMRSNNYRFFPLAHQDLHILSWFTPYVKAWMLVNALELIAIAILTTKSVQILTKNQHTKGTLLLISVLLFFHPATGMGFFQFIYCERMLTLCFAGYIFFYSRYNQEGGRTNQNLVFVCALLGVFIKDIGFILFTAPPLLILGAAALRGGWQKAWANHPLERWLCSLIGITAIAYLVLSLIPSLYLDGKSFDQSKQFLFEADPRLVALIAFNCVRAFQILKGHTQLNLIDGLNVAALSYALALFLSVGYPYDSFWTLPVQLVTTLDVAYAWLAWIAPKADKKISNPNALSILGLGIAGGLLWLDSTMPMTFAKRVNKIWTTQDKWEKSMKKLNILSKGKRTSGKDSNIIFMRTWIEKPEYARTLQYDRLIEYNPDTRLYTIVDGKNVGSNYQPQAGDLLANIDKRKISKLGSDQQHFKEIYAYSKRMNYGRVYEYQP